MIISGGVNIYPREIEDVIISHPAVADAAVIGVPDNDLGQSVTAVIEPLHWSNASELAEELRAWMGERLARYKCPRTVHFQERLPRTDAGKLYKRSLVERYGGG